MCVCASVCDWVVQKTMITWRQVIAATAVSSTYPLRASMAASVSVCASVHVHHHHLPPSPPPYSRHSPVSFCPSLSPSLLTLFPTHAHHPHLHPTQANSHSHYQSTTNKTNFPREIWVCVCGWVILAKGGWGLRSLCRGRRRHVAGGGCGGCCRLWCGCMLWLGGVPVVGRG